MRSWGGLVVCAVVLGWALVLLGVLALVHQKPTYIVRRVHDTVYVKMPPETVYVQAKLPRTGGRVKVQARGGHSMRDSAIVAVVPVGDSLLIDVTLHLAPRDTLLPVTMQVPVQVENRFSGHLYGIALGVCILGLLVALGVVL